MSLKITQAECIKTERLELKSYRSSDKEQLIKLLTNEEITKTFMVPEFKSKEHMMSLIEKLTNGFIFGLAFMIIGTVFVIYDTLKNKKTTD